MLICAFASKRILVDDQAPKAKWPGLSSRPLKTLKCRSAVQLKPWLAFGIGAIVALALSRKASRSPLWSIAVAQRRKTLQSG
jgi:uncharacterized membrane protein YoaK (UPF0700 family)